MLYIIIILKIQLENKLEKYLSFLKCENMYVLILQNKVHFLLWIWPRKLQMQYCRVGRIWSALKKAWISQDKNLSPLRIKKLLQTWHFHCWLQSAHPSPKTHHCKQPQECRNQYFKYIFKQSFDTWRDYSLKIDYTKGSFTGQVTLVNIFHLIDTLFFFLRTTKCKTPTVVAVCFYWVTSLMLNMTLEMVPTSFWVRILSYTVNITVVLGWRNRLSLRICPAK
jgi:hypothetical protein